MSRNNTGNPIGSDAWLDFQDDVRDLDVRLLDRENDYSLDRLGRQVMNYHAFIRSGNTQGFATLADMNAVQGGTNQIAYVTDDGENNGLYRWNGSRWERTSLRYAKDSEFQKEKQERLIADVGAIPIDKAPYSPGQNADVEVIKNGDIVTSLSKAGVWEGQFSSGGRLLEPLDVDKAPYSPGQNADVEVYAEGLKIFGLGENKMPFFLGSGYLPEEKLAPFSPSDTESEEIFIGSKKWNEEVVQAIASLAKSSWFYKNDELFVATINGSKAVSARTAIYNPVAISEKACLAAAETGWFSSGIKQVVVSEQGHIFPRPDKTLVVIPHYGQSLSVGSQGFPALTIDADNPDYALKFNGIDNMLSTSGNLGVTQPFPSEMVTGFSPLKVEAAGATNNSVRAGRELSCVSMGQALARVLREAADIPLRVLSFSSGLGGTPLDLSDFPNLDQSGIGLKKGSQCYSNLINAIALAKTIAAENGWNVVVPAICFQHGEGDAGNSNYGERIKQLISDLNVDIKTVTSQTMDVHMYASLLSNSIRRSTIGLEQSISVSHDTPLFRLSGTNYPALPAVDLNDYTHLSARGYEYLGQMYAKVLLHDIKNGFGSFVPFSFRSAELVGNYIDVIFNVPVPPIRYKVTDVVLAHNTWGFDFVDSDQSAEIESVEITGDSSIRITLTREPTGSEKTLSAAMVGHPSASDRSLSTVARTNLCDSDSGWVTKGGDTLENWLIPFKHKF